MSEPIQRDYLTPEKTAWTTPDGVLHVDAIRMCEVLGIEPTQENQKRIENEVAAFFAKKIPGISISGISDLI